MAKTLYCKIGWHDWAAKEYVWVPIPKRGEFDPYIEHEHRVISMVCVNCGKTKIQVPWMTLTRRNEEKRG